MEYKIPESVTITRYKKGFVVALKFKNKDDDYIMSTAKHRDAYKLVESYLSGRITKNGRKATT